MQNKIKCLFTSLLLGMITVTKSYAHEPWLLTEKHFETLRNQTRPLLFSQWGPFNISVLTLSIMGLIIWIILNRTFPEKNHTSTLKENIALFSLRLGAGSSLVLLGLGLLPKLGIDHLSQPTLLASEFLISSMGKGWTWLPILEIIVGVAFILGAMTRGFALCLLWLMLINLFYFGSGFFQYIGFYLGIVIYLVTQGSGKFAIQPDQKQLISSKSALFILQILTGLNFLYSAISIKFLTPNVDIGILEMNEAFTFGIPYDYFTFLMLITEALFGLLLIMGFRLWFIASLLIILFVFLSLNLSENIFAHNFIIGILLLFIFRGGCPLMINLKKVSK